jgi:hypothetical protein
MLPDFYDDENLPEGNHDCSWPDFVARFAYNEQRRMLLVRLQHVLGTAKKCQFLLAVIFGSYITSKEDPGDVDLVWVIDQTTNTDLLQIPCKQLLEHQESKARFGCDLFFFPDSEGFMGRINDLWGYNRDYTKRRGLVILKLSDYDAQ